MAASNDPAPASQLPAPRLGRPLHLGAYGDGIAAGLEHYETNDMEDCPFHDDTPRAVEWWRGYHDALRLAEAGEVTR